MTKGYLLGCDIGTYSSKGVLVTTDGKVLFESSIPHDVSIPKPGWMEHDPDDVWLHDFLFIVKDLLNKSGIDPKEILSVGISSISTALVMLDKDRKPLRPSILYGVDTRATEEVEEIKESEMPEKPIEAEPTEKPVEKQETIEEVMKEESLVSEPEEIKTSEESEAPEEKQEEVKPEEPCEEIKPEEEIEEKKEKLPTIDEIEPVDRTNPDYDVAKEEKTVKELIEGGAESIYEEDKKPKEPKEPEEKKQESEQKTDKDTEEQQNSEEKNSEEKPDENIEKQQSSEEEKEEEQEKKQEQDSDEKESSEEEKESESEKKQKSKKHYAEENVDLTDVFNFSNK